MIVCVALIGKKTFVPEREQLRFHYIVHSSLDVFEERRLRRPGPQSCSSQDMYLGHLCPIEEFRLYGYQTSTHIKIVAVLTEGEQARDADLRAVFVGLHQLYINYVQSPFSSLAGRITSDRFHHGVERQVNLYNGVS